MEASYSVVMPVIIYMIKLRHIPEGRYFKLCNADFNQKILFADGVTSKHVTHLSLGREIAPIQARSYLAIDNVYW
jgi:hypothetical protein